MTNSLFTDQKYLKENQYKNSHNLATRINIHQHFSTNRINWQQWVLDQLTIKTGMRILEVGCGPGMFWRDNAGRFPDGILTVIGDLSLGMVQEAKAGIGDNVFINLNAEAIPLTSNTFDIVIANHMLYHLPHLAVGLTEIARVLKPHGVLCAATNGTGHLKEMFDLAKEFDPRFEEIRRNFNLTSGFNLGNAIELLRKDFTEVEVIPLENNLWVTESKPIVDFVMSGVKDQESVSPKQLAGLNDHFQKIIDSKGGIHISKETGLVLAHK